MRTYDILRYHITLCATTSQVFYLLYGVIVLLHYPIAKYREVKSGVMSLVRQNFHEECEDALNKQINVELYASYVYLSMAYYFERSDVALPGHYRYFKKQSNEEREHAMKFMTYQNKRGGSIVLTPIESPPKNDWVGARHAMSEALKLEKNVNDNILQLHAVATKHCDPHFLDFLEMVYLQEQVDSINEIANYVTRLERVGEGLGLHIFDQELAE